MCVFLHVRIDVRFFLADMCTCVCVCENSSLQMHLLLVTGALNYFGCVDEYLLPAARTGHVLHQVGLTKQALQDSLNKGNRNHSPVLLQNVCVSR